MRAVVAILAVLRDGRLRWLGGSAAFLGQVVPVEGAFNFPVTVGIAVKVGRTDSGRSDGRVVGGIGGGQGVRGDDGVFQDGDWAANAGL